MKNKVLKAFALTLAVTTAIPSFAVTTHAAENVSEETSQIDFFENDAMYCTIVTEDGNVISNEETFGSNGFSESSDTKEDVETVANVGDNAAETGRVAKHYNLSDGGNWDGTHFTKDGQTVTDAFFCDGTYTYYLQHDGTPMKSRLTYHPNGKCIIYFDEKGHEVFNDFANVKASITGESVNDLCYFDTFGCMYIDTVSYDKSGKNLFYANPYGVIERNGWFTYSDLQGGGIGYANADGTLLKDQYTTDTTGNTVYMEGDGSVRGSRTGVKHEHNWKPHYTTVVTQEAYDETTRHIDQECYMLSQKEWDEIHEIDKKVNSPEEFNKAVMDYFIANGTINLTEMANNLTPEERQFYIDFVEKNCTWDKECLDQLKDPNDPQHKMENAIWEYYGTIQPEKYGINKALEFQNYDYPLDTPIHHDAVTEQVIDYYYCEGCGQARIGI